MRSRKFPPNGSGESGAGRSSIARCAVPRASTSSRATTNTSYYQTLLGAWPAAFAARPPDATALGALSARIEQFLVKALREGKSETSWDNPNEAYEQAATAFARGLLERSPNPFLADFAEFAGRIAYFAMLSGLSQTVLRLTVPGVPDTYQGTETWNLSLVDPDNRAKVDFAALQARGDALAGERAAGLLRSWPDGRVKMHVTREVLQLRRRMPELFLDGRYEPLAVEGARARHLLAFARLRGEAAVVVLAGRLFVGLAGWEQPCLGPTAWADTRVLRPPARGGRWRDILSDTRHTLAEGPLRAADILADMPAAVLVREAD